MDAWKNVGGEVTGLSSIKEKKKNVERSQWHGG